MAQQLYHWTPTRLTPVRVPDLVASNSHWGMRVGARDPRRRIEKGLLRVSPEVVISHFHSHCLCLVLSPASLCVPRQKLYQKINKI